MTTKKFKIRVDEGKTVEREVPEISLELAPEYPKKWFSDHPRSKPIVRIPKSGLTQEQLARKMGDHWISDPNIEPTLEFNAYFLNKYVKDRLGSDWKSYGRTMSEKNQEITPLSLLTIEEYEVKPDTGFGEALPEREEFFQVVHNFFKFFQVVHNFHSVHPP